MSHIRLSTLATTSLAIMLIGTSYGAQASQQAEPTEVLIFGDVKQSGIFQVPNPVSAAEFVSRAGGLSAGTANVRVVRGGFGDAKVVWGAHVSKGQPCDFQVAHGDMLVVHSLQRLSGDANASKSIEVSVINSQTRPLMVTLSPGQVRVADVLKEVKMSDHEFRIVRTNPRAVPVNANANTILEHGDLLMVGNPPDIRPAPLARVTQASGQQTTMVPVHVPESAGPLFIPVSEQTVLQDDVDVIDDAEPIPVEANYGALSVPSPEMRPTPGQGISSPQPPAGFVPTPTNGSAIRDPLKTDPWLLGAPPNAPPSNSGSAQNLQQGADGIPPFDGNQSAYSGGGSNYPDGYNSQPPNGYGTNSYPSGMPGAQPGTGLPPKPVEDPADAAATPALPLPSELDAFVQDDSSNSTMWYVAGLAGALLLVLGAWVYGSRAMSESPQTRVDPYKRPVNRQHSTTVKYPPVGTAPSPGAKVTAAPIADKPRTPTIKPIQPITAVAPIVAATAATAHVAQAVSPIVPAMPKPQPRPVAATSPVQQPIPTPVTPVTAAPIAAAPAIQARVEPVVAAPPVVQEPTPSRPAVAPVAAIDPEPIPVPQTSTTRILDALINNSLPVSEQPVQLPVNLEFFGDSSGPKQLRIDPAQPALRGPHTAVSAGQGQRSDARNSAAYDS